MEEEDADPMLSQLLDVVDQCSTMCLNTAIARNSRDIQLLSIKMLVSSKYQSYKNNCNNNQTDNQTEQPDSNTTDPKELFKTLTNTDFEQYDPAAEALMQSRIIDDLRAAMDNFDGTNCSINRTGDFTISIDDLHDNLLQLSLSYLGPTDIHHVPAYGRSGQPGIHCVCKRFNNLINQNYNKNEIMYTSTCWTCNGKNYDDYNGSHSKYNYNFTQGILLTVGQIYKKYLFVADTNRSLVCDLIFFDGSIKVVDIKKFQSPLNVSKTKKYIEVVFKDNVNRYVYVCKC